MNPVPPFRTFILHPSSFILSMSSTAWTPWWTSPWSSLSTPLLPIPHSAPPRGHPTPKIPDAGDGAGVCAGAAAGERGGAGGAGAARRPLPGPGGAGLPLQGEAGPGLVRPTGGRARQSAGGVDLLRGAGGDDREGRAPGGGFGDLLAPSRPPL